MDETALFDDEGAIDTGVTSGADPTAWDPIGIENGPGEPGSSADGKKPD